MKRCLYCSRFVRGFMIETYGLPAFQQLYGARNYEIVYGKSLPFLEKE
jgi:hypothetical protein